MFLEVKLAGGLGNQLFQYATARSLCIQHKIPFLLLNPESYRNESLGRRFSLGHLQVKGTVLQNDFLKKLFRPRTKLNRVFCKLGLIKSMDEQGFVLQKPLLPAGLFVTVKGYWQSEWYFNSIRQELIQELRPRHLPVLPEWMQQENTVAVHVRRTDYLSEPRYGFIGEKYYLDAFAKVRSAIGDPRFIVFSDDMEWCKQHFAGPGIHFCEEPAWQQDFEQLYLISRCTHQVIANSSFSWWGAWLNTNPGKLVIRPAEPFIEKSLLYESHYPDNWIAI